MPESLEPDPYANSNEPGPRDPHAAIHFRTAVFLGASGFCHPPPRLGTPHLQARAPGLLQGCECWLSLGWISSSGLKGYIS